jgi:hypothetical protein
VTYPLDLVIRPLEVAEWPMVKEMYEMGWKGEMPAVHAGNVIYGIFLEEKIVGFAHLEQVLHLNAIYIEDEHRARHLMEAAFETIDDDMPRGGSMIIFPYKGLKRLLRRFGFWGGKTVEFWRKNY